MLPLVSSAAVVVNAMVAETRVLPATRSPAAMVKTTPVGCENMEPVLMGPAEHELDDVTTENVFDAAFSVVVKVTPVIIIY